MNVVFISLVSLFCTLGFAQDLPKLGVAQINPTVGDTEDTVKQILINYKKASAAGVEILVTPEFVLPGYPSYDLLDNPEMFKKTQRALRKLINASKKSETAILVGHLAKTPYDGAKAYQSVASVIYRGETIFTQPKSLLPTYDVFDEARYFAPAQDIKIFEFKGKRIAIMICEDWWFYDKSGNRFVYDNNTIEKIKALKPDLAISLSGSPYSEGKQDYREKLHGEIAKALGVPFVWVNQAGATDEILFDGQTFVLDNKGRLVERFSHFETDYGTIEFKNSKITVNREGKENSVGVDEIDMKIKGIVMGIRDYWAKTGHKKAIWGLSGGIDSAVAGALTIMALGKENVRTLGMPTKSYSPADSITDAELFAKNWGIHYEVDSIQPLLDAYRETHPNAGKNAIVNIQARFRADLTHAESNDTNDMLVIATGNKSELMMGFTTLYGDMAGALCPNGDLYKTDVYAIARRINQIFGREMIPQNIIDKEPSDGLWTGAVTANEIPPYWALDQVLRDHVEKRLSVKQLTKKYRSLLPNWPDTWVHQAIRRAEINEFKRNQGPVILKLTRKAIGIGRRIPNAKKLDIGGKLYGISVISDCAKQLARAGGIR